MEQKIVESEAQTSKAKSKVTILIIIVTLWEGPLIYLGGGGGEIDWEIVFGAGLFFALQAAQDVFQVLLWCTTNMLKLCSVCFGENPEPPCQIFNVLSLSFIYIYLDLKKYLYNIIMVHNI